ncbi:MAG TPA: ACT domain-containing protein [Ktedonobacteraceae bacterium]|nr:ACT domain-containing protein [Ktedonobacteraceae bacterium]
MNKLSLSLLPQKYAVCQFHPDEHIPYWALLGDFVSLTRTQEELSIVCQQDNVPGDVKVEGGWRCLQVHGAFDFSVAGVHVSLAIPLAEADISVLAIATYATDYLLIKEENVERALRVLEQAGHYIERTGREKSNI